jgi:two-component system, NtrC family, sensor kinase
MSSMNYLHLLAGLPQIGVVCYALRLTRRFSLSKVGWLLVASLTLLALLCLLYFSTPFQSFPPLIVKLEIAHGLASLFLLTILVLLEKVLKERARNQEILQEARTTLETRVALETAELTQATAELQAEINERKKIQEQMEKSHRDLLTVTREAAMSEVAIGVLHNVGNVLNSVNVSACLISDQLRESKVEFVSRLARLLSEHAGDLGAFVTQNEKGKQLPAFLSQLAKHLQHEHALLIKEFGFIRTKIDHIKEIVTTQQSYGKVSGVAERIRLTDLMEDVLRIQAPDIAAHEIRIQRQYEPGLPEVIVDKHKVLQIMLNLLSNAKHACADSDRNDKEVIVRVTNGDDKVRIAICDNGVGIPPANLNKIFNHGFTTRKKGGHGFGLHSGALAARDIGGQLTASSDGPGKGAAFTLELPLKPA